MQNHLPGFHLDPVTVQVDWVTFDLDIGSGGGLHLTGSPGKRTDLYGTITIADASTAGGSTPIITLEQVHGANLTLDLEASDPASCNVGVRIVDSTNVVLFKPTIRGCRTGVEIVGASRGIRIVGGKVENYGENGVGIRIQGANAVSVDSTELRPHPGGNGVSPTARGVVVDGGARAISLRLGALRANAVGVEVREASLVTIQGKIGVPAEGAPAAGAGNAVGIDLVGPATDVRIGQNPFPVAYQGVDPEFIPPLPDFVTFVANNGRTVADGAGIRIRDVTRVTIDRTYVGLLGSFTEAGNSVGIQVVAQPSGTPRDVKILRSHIGDNTDAGIEVVGATGRVTIDDCLFAGPPSDGWVALPPFPANTLSWPGGECTDVADLPAGFDATAAPTGAAPSAGTGPGVRIRDGAAGVSVTRCNFVGTGVSVENASGVTGRALRIYGAPAAGLRLLNSTDSRFLDTQVVHSGASGILLDGSTDTEITGCSAGNAGSGLEVTGAPVAAGGEHQLGKLLPRAGGESVIIPPAGTLWAHQPPRLEDQPVALVLYGNAQHGLHAHDGAVPVTLSASAVLGNTQDGARVEDYSGIVQIFASAIGVRHAPPAVDAALPNAGHGVHVRDTLSLVRVGGSRRGNVISGNTGDGVRVVGSDRVRVEANFVGMNAAGASAVPNGGAGVHAQSCEGLYVGGVLPEEGNLISSNGSHGILIQNEGVARRPTVQNNLVGVDATGSAPRGNGGDGIRVSVCTIWLGAPRIIGNLVSANAGAGIAGQLCGSQLLVLRNAVGDANPPVPVPPTPQRLPNVGSGIELDSVDGALLRGNVVYAPVGQRGIWLTGSSGNRLDQNEVLESGMAGIALTQDSRDNRLTANVVSGGGADGVRVGRGSVRNTLRANRITANGARGIRLVDGGNAGIPAPTLTFVHQKSNGRWTVYGRSTTPNGSLVEVFADEGDEARIPLGTAPVYRGEWLLDNLADPPPAALAPATSLSSLTLHATVTDRFGNTSELGDHDPTARTPTCDLGDPPPGAGDGGIAGQIVTTRGPQFAGTGVSTGDSAVLADLTPGGGSATVCGSRIAFSGGGDIYVRDLIAGTTTALTTGAAQDVEPAFSPDCTKIAFASDRAGAFDIFTMGADGSSPTPVTSDADEDRSPTWSPNGLSLAFSRRTAATDGFALFVWHGGQPVLLYDGPGDDRDPAWHPGDDRVAFTRCTAATCQLTVFHPTVGVAQAIGQPACHDRHPAWLVVPGGAPDGSDDTSYLLTERRSASTPDAGPTHVVLLSDLGWTAWRVTPAAESDGAPACCL